MRVLIKKILENVLQKHATERSFERKTSFGIPIVLGINLAVNKLNLLKEGL